MTPFVMPSLGSNMESGTVVAWHKKAGDRVQRGDVVVEIETDKGNIEVEIFTSGVLESLLAEPGQKVPVGQPLAMLREDGVPADAVAPAVPAPAVAQGAIPGPASAVRASPLARRRARELLVDLAKLTATGPRGIVSVEDVERAAAVGAEAGAAAKAAPTAPPAATSLDRMRRAIAAAMVQSKREIPHYYVATTVDLGPAMAWLERENAGRPPDARLIPAVLFLKAAALALHEIPELNARWTGASAPPLPDVHVGAAIALRGGGVVSLAISHTDRRPLGELMAAFKDLVARARAGQFRSSEMTDGTLTVTSLGDRGVEEVWPVIYPPQVAIVGAGRILVRPWVIDGAVVPRPTARLTLAADHRVSDGHRGGLYLRAIEALLAQPERL